MKKKIIVGNWKMNPVTFDEAKTIFDSIRKVSLKLTKINLVICPPFVYLKSLIKDDKSVSIGAQNISEKESGSLTGEISIKMLKDLGIQYAIIGHSERRNMGENDELISRKVQISLDSGINTILCIGEKERNEQGDHLDFIRNQIKNSLNNVSKKNTSKLIIAYEPVWAIGAKEAMDSNSINEMTIFIRKTISDIYGQDNAMSMPVLYGGSVNAKNALEIIKVGNVDGLLIGRESLNVEGFGELLKTIDSI